jgi:hypothetical protein
MKKTGLISVAALTALPASAKCGSVDYSWGADALAEAHDFIVTLMLYIGYLVEAIAGIVAIYAALKIYIKMNTGEDGIVKDILMLFGAVIFLIASLQVFPAFFGYNI